MVSMRSSGAAVFTRQNPFPRDPPLPKSHYSPTRSRKIPKQQKRLALSPVRFTPKPISPERHTFPLKKEDPVFHEGSHSVLLCPPTSDECFSESWPSTDLSHSTSSSTSSPCSEAQMYTTKNVVARETTVAKEPSVLAKYIERFRYGKPQSREDRLREAAEEEDGGFWWMSTSPPSSSTPTQASDKHARESTGLNGALSTHRPISKSHVRDMDDLSMLTLSELSHCDPEEPEEILQLQERANRLLQKSEHSLGSGSMPISSEGLGCSDFSSPVSVDEPIRKPAVPTLMASTNLILDPSFSEGPSFHTPAVGSVGSGVRREDDILFQWRLRRKMEQARQSCHEASSHNSLLHVHMAQTVGPNQAHHSHLSNMPLQKSHLAFTPVTLASLDPPTPEPALPISSPSVSRLQPDATIRPQEQPNPKIKPDTLHHSLREKNKIEATSVPPRHHRQIGTQVNIAETKEEHHRRQKSSSPSPQTSESTEGWWPDTQGKKASTVKGKTERREKSAPPSRKKNSERVGSPVRARRAKGHEGVSRKAREVSGKSSFQEEGQRSKQRGRSGDLEPSSPIHNALGQVVSEVLFLGVDSPTQCKTPSSSVSSAFTPPPPQQSPVTPPTDVQRPFEVIDQLMQDAEDSDGTEFEDDPLLQVLRRQRKWVKEQLCEVDMMLERFLPLTAPTST
ncbi:proline and serine-rich protein 3 [Triplophysa rosa]|uniref:Proline and serine-rich protein 3 n=1 Tax=Triplophysa rosa TaxID=992332 RepID=A0A9W7TS60_TRIRA|nr:proline and serine-rich protein 3 [Triplophysa rosa]KAI7801187.1 putative proline and serine-rich protein 3 [Triplophysa rosa]